MQRAYRLVIALAAVLLAGNARAGNPQVTIATPLAIPAASIFIARDKNYFSEAGIDARIEVIDSLSKTMALVATNQIQIAQGAINAGVFNAVAQGLPVIMTLGSGATPVYHNFVVRHDLRDKIKTPADLKGRDIAVSGPGSGSVYEVASVLEGVGLHLSDVNIKPLSFPQMTSSLANGSIDVAVMYSPFSDYVIDQGIAVSWIDPEEGYIKILPMTSLAFVASTDWIAKDRDLARKTFIALARGGRDYCQAYHHGPNRGETLDIMMRNGIGADRAQLDALKWQARDPDGAFNRDSILDIQRVFQNEGFLHQATPYEKLIDESFTADVAKALGPFDVANKASSLKGCR